MLRQLFVVALLGAGCGRIGFDAQLGDDADAALPGGDWFGVEWSYRKRVMIAAGKVRSDLTEVPVAIIDVDPDLAARARADGADLVFTASDGMTRLPFELEHFDPSGSLVGWVNVPAVAAAADTVIYLYYGNPSGTSQQNAAATWSDFRAVWHMRETPTVDGATRDSTSNDNDGTFQGGMTAGAQVPGRAGGALDFDGTNDFLGVTSSPSLSFGTGTVDTGLTIEAWVFMRDASAFKIAAKGTMVGDLEYYFRTGDQTDDLLLMRVYDAAGNYIGRRYSAGLTPLQNRWIHLATTYDGTGTSAGLRLYVDGERVDDVDATGTNYTAMSPLPTALDIGRYVTGGEFAFGLIDELRIAEGARSPAWIHASYANLAPAGGFVSIGAEEQR